MGRGGAAQRRILCARCCQSQRIWNALSYCCQKRRKSLLLLSRGVGGDLFRVLFISLKLRMLEYNDLVSFFVCFKRNQS